MEPSKLDYSFKRLFGPYPRYDLVQKYKPPKFDSPIIIAGPCSIESSEQIWRIVDVLRDQGVTYLRGGVFRAGTYPSVSCGFGFINEKLINEFSLAAHSIGAKCLIEVLDYHFDSMTLVDKYADAYQVGARSMQNYMLLKLMSKKKRPVFLKNGLGNTLDEYLGAAEWLLKDGYCEPHLILRGSSSFHNHVRWDLSISMIPAIKKLTNIPIIVDGSHGTGRCDLVEPMIMAGIAAGADGFLIEVHPNPDKSLSDSEQATPLEDFARIRSKALRISGILKVPYEK